MEMYGGEFTPITTEIGFLLADIDTVASFFLLWQKEIQKKRGVEVCAQSIAGGKLGELFTKLLPLTSVERRRYLFVPTNSSWTAYFDNGWMGADASSVVGYLSRKIGCKGVKIRYVPSSKDGKYGAGGRRYPAVVMEVYSSKEELGLNIERSLACVFDGRKWIFTQNGDVQSFENCDHYKNRLIKDKFTLEIMSDYLKSMGILAFSDEFYMSDRGVLIEKFGPSANGVERYSLELAKSSW